MSVSVVTDSVASIPADLLAANGIDVVSLFINDGESNQAELDMDVAAFYRRLEDMRTLPTSSQPSVESMLDGVQAGLERGDDVLGVFISSDMSGTCQTARMAADMLAEEYPDGRIEILDSRSNSMEEGYGSPRGGGTRPRPATRSSDASRPPPRRCDARATCSPRTRWSTCVAAGGSAAPRRSSAGCCRSSRFSPSRTARRRRSRA